MATQEEIERLSDHDVIPDDVLEMVHRAVSRCLDAQQAFRAARDYSRIIGGADRSMIGRIDREYFVDRRRRSGVTAESIRENRATLALFVELAAENGIDGGAVVREVAESHRRARRANPSGRFFECRRVAREMEAIRNAAPYVGLEIGFMERSRRHGYDVRYQGICSAREIPEPLSMTPREYRRKAARILWSKHTAKVAVWHRELSREAMRESLRARGKQTPERERLAAEINGRRAWRIGNPLTPEGIRRHYLAAKRKRLESIHASAKRLAERGEGRDWFAGVEVETVDGTPTLVVLAIDIRAAKRDAKHATAFEGKPVVIRKAKSQKVK